MDIKDAKALNERLDTIIKLHEKVSAEYEPKLDKYMKDMHEFGKASKGTQEEVEKMGATITQLQADFIAVKEALADLEADSGGDAEPDAEASKSAGEHFVGSEQYKAWVPKSAYSKTSGKVALKMATMERSFKGRKSFGNDAFLLGTNALGMANEYFRPDGPETNKRPGLLIRTLMTNIDIGDANSVRGREEVAEYELVCKLTAAISASGSAAARTLAVDRVAGFKTTAPFNTITLDNGSDPAETFTITTIVPTDAEENPMGPGTITTASTASVKAYPIGQLATANQFAPTAEAQLKPKSLDKFKKVTLQVEKLASWVEASNEELTDNARAADLIDRRLMGRYGREEDKHLLYGDGVGDTVLGFFNHTTIPNFLWSLSPSGTTKLDFIVRLCFQLTSAEHICTDILVNPSDMRDVVLLKGTDGHYVFWKQQTEGSAMRIFGAKLHWTTAINSGDVLVGDFPQASTFYKRMEAEIFVGQPDDMFLKNEYAVLVEGRFAMGIDQPLGFAIGSFDSAP